MKRAIIAIVTALAVVAAVTHFSKKSTPRLGDIPTPVYDSWVHWKQTNGKSYGTNYEEAYRMKVYNDNFNIVANHNNEKSTFKLALNKFADMTNQEFAKTYTGLMPKGLKANKTVKFNTDNLQASKNWVTEGAVAAVKNQGACGSCWAFSTVCAVESANYLQRGQSSVTPLSEQQLVDCAGGSYGNQGCNGGLMDNGFRYVEDHPLATEDDYPYRGKDGTCQADQFTGVGKVSGYHDVESNSPDQLRAALSHQPVSVAIEADKSIFQLYDSGVITSSSCGTQLDHGVTAVGYGTLDGEDYFLVRNSWGSGWGDEGYVKIGASSDNICGILSQPSYPTA